MSTQPEVLSSRSRQIGLVLVVVGAVILALIPIPTSLGVKVQPVGDLHGHELWFKQGHDAIWRVWWRSRDQIFNLTHQWPMTIGLLVLATSLFACLLGCVWFALSIPVSDPESIPE